MARRKAIVMFGQSNMVGANMGWPTTFANDKRFEFLNDPNARVRGLAGVKMMDIYANSFEPSREAGTNAANRPGLWSVPDDRVFTDSSAAGNKGRDTDRDFTQTPQYNADFTTLWEWATVPTQEGKVDKAGNYQWDFTTPVTYATAEDVTISGTNTITINAGNWLVDPDDYPRDARMTISGSGNGNDGVYSLDYETLQDTTVLTIAQGTGLPTLNNGADNITITIEKYIEGVRKRLNHSDTSIEGPGLFGQADSIGSEFALGWNLMNTFGEELFIVKMGVGGTVATPRHIRMDIPGRGWWHGPNADGDTVSFKNTWNPSHPESLLDILMNHYLLGNGLAASFADDQSEYVGGAKTILASQGDQLDIQGVFVLLGESDAEEPDRAAYYEEGYREIQETLRNFIVDNDLTTIARADEIPWVHAKVRTGYGDADPLTGHDATTGIPLVNGAIDKLVAEDPFMESVNTDDFPFYANDPVHYTSDAMVTLGDRFFEGWQKITDYAQRFQTRDNSQVRDIVRDARDRYQLGQGAGAPQIFTDEQIIDHIQKAWQSIRRRLGDSAYWLKRTEEFTWNLSANAYLELPWQVERVLTIRRTNEPDLFFRPEQRGIQPNGNPAYWVPDQYRSGTYSVEYMQAWQSMSDMDDYIPMPEQHEELLVVMTVRRMATYGGKTQMDARMVAEADRLFAEISKAANTFERNRNDVMRTAYRNVRTKARDVGSTNKRTY